MATPKPKPKFCSVTDLSARDHAYTAIHCQPLAGDVFASGRCIQHTQTLEVFIVAQAIEWRARGQLLFTQCLERAHGHLAREETGANGIDGNVVLAPFHCQCAREVDAVSYTHLRAHETDS